MVKTKAMLISYKVMTGEMLEHNLQQLKDTMSLKRFTSSEEIFKNIERYKPDLLLLDLDYNTSGLN